jgi:hypothetical protein
MWSINEPSSGDIISSLHFPRTSLKKDKHGCDQEQVSVLNVVQMTSSIGRVLVQLARLNRDVRLASDDVLFSLFVG